MSEQGDAAAERRRLAMDALLAAEDAKTTAPVTPRPPAPRSLARPESPVGLVISGFVMAVVGGGVVGAGAGLDWVIMVFVGAVLGSAGAVFTMVGVVAAGVRLGMRHTDYERESRGAG